VLELDGFEITKGYAIDSMPPSVAIMIRSHDLQSAKGSRRGDREFLTYLAAALNKHRSFYSAIKLRGTYLTPLRRHSGCAETVSG
jgi:hypothetical protein